MNEMNYRGYRDEDYANYRDYRDYANYREEYDNYRGDYRDYDNYRTRDYDRRGGKINNRNYRSYRMQDYHEELEMTMEDMREQYRKLEDIAEMASPQDKNMLMKIAQKEKENYNYLKQIMEK